MSNIEKGDVVTFYSSGSFVVSYNNNDGTVDLVPLNDDGSEASENEVEYVPVEVLKRIPRIPRVGDVYKTKSPEPFGVTYPDELVVVSVGSDGKVTLYSTLDKTTYQTNTEDLDQRKYYDLVRKSQ